MEQMVLSPTSHLRVRTERTRVGVVKWLKRRYVDVKHAGGFDKLDGWSLDELSHGEPLHFHNHQYYSDGCESP